ncbi:MAG TPA: murein L,D-transpeptidase catalytic domain family protein [Segetibacter sp.]
MKMTLRKKLYVFVASAFVIHFLFIYAKSSPFTKVANPDTAVVAIDSYPDVSGNEVSPKNNLSLYDTLNLGGLGLSREAFNYAIAGYKYLRAEGKLQNDNIVSIVDFSLASSKKRLFIIDLSNNKILFNTYVSHGRNSGREVANQFSNQAESNKSSLGFYVTGGTYMGKHGFSMRLLGEEKGINDNANSRAIVMHSAAYVSEAAIKMQGFIGRSLGCPALPEALTKPIIEKIKNGSCLFLYGPDKSYASNSTILKKVA